MRNGQLNNLNILTSIRKELRNSTTEAEIVLWKQLKGSQLSGRKFRRQHSVGLFVLDFHYPSERLAVELDGDVHDSVEARIHDDERQKAIQIVEIRIIRFRNTEVMQNLDEVLATIVKHFDSW